jgi:beta-lactamase class D
MAEAIKNSTVWYYQELARRVGGKQMKYWLDKVPYGNADTSGGIDQFWLHGGLLISPLQQIDFLKRLHDDKLPFSQRNMNIVKDILILGDSAGTVLRGKTGWTVKEKEKEQIGWFVGYVEKKGRAFYFANCIYSRNLDNPDFVTARKEIALQILRDLKILE